MRNKVRYVGNDILDVDLLAFEKGGAKQRQAVVDGVMRSLATGFVYTSHDLSEDMLDSTYGMLFEFFNKPVEEKRRYIAAGANGQTGYTGVLVETAEVSDKPDWKEMLNWGKELPAGHPMKRKFPQAYPDQVLPEASVPGISKVLYAFHDAMIGLQTRFLRIIALGLGCGENFFDGMVDDGCALNRAIRYPSMTQVPEGGHVWAAEHGDINLITALPRATAKGLQVKHAGRWIDAVPPSGHVILNTGIMLERLTNGVIPIGWHRVVADPDYDGERYSIVQFCHPRPSTLLAPLPTCVTEENPLRYPTVTAGDALDEVIYRINLVENARRVGD
ncbi:MAG: isopenicillin N synthase family dioxygenase [Actinomycetota bacterium]